MAFGFDGVHNFDGSRISEVGQKQAPQLNPILNQQVGDFETTYTNMGGMGERMERERRRQASQLNPYAYQPDRIGNYSLQRRELDVDLIRENQRGELPAQEISPIPQQNVQDSQQPIAQQQPYFQSPFSFGLGSLGYGGFSPYGGGFSPFGMMGGYGGGMGGYGGFGGYGGMMGGFSPFGGYGGGYGGMMGGFSPFGGGFSPFGGGIYGGGIYNLPQAQQAPQQQAPQQQTAQTIQQQANPFGDSIKQQYAQPVGQTTLFR